jgi:hypothetical protein
VALPSAVKLNFSIVSRVEYPPDTYPNSVLDCPAIPYFVAVKLPISVALSSDANGNLSILFDAACALLPPLAYPCVEED